MELFSVKIREVLVCCGVFAGILVSAVSMASADDFSLSYSSLYGGESVYGIDASAEPSPFVNTDNYTITASGDATGTKTDVGFYAYGIYSSNPVNIVNSGQFSLIANGGTAVASGESFAYVEAYGIYSGAGVTNSGDLTVNATRGTATNSTDTSEIVAESYGIASEGDVTNGGDINVTATGGTDGGIAFVSAYGIESGGSVANSGGINVTATGGTGGATALAYAYGIDADGSVANSGGINVTATGGTGGATALAYAYGIEADGAVTNSGGINVTATSGTDGAAALASAYGIEAGGSVENSGGITVNASGGTADAGEIGISLLTAYGIDAGGAVTNSGDINSTVIGGTADAGETETSMALASAHGIDADGSVANSGGITVTATGGTADAGETAISSASASGIDAGASVANSGGITVTATGGTADAGETELSGVTASASGIEADGSVANSGDINVIATGGTVAAGEPVISLALASAYGIDAGASVENSGAITSIVIGGTANSDLDSALSIAESYGIVSEGAVTNSGAITTIAIGGTATAVSSGAYSFANACGIDASGEVTNNGAITVIAQGGTANALISDDENDAYTYATLFGSQGDAGAVALGIRADGDIDNSGAITVTATGGTATADSSESYALAIGLQSGVNVTNTGNITATATYGEGLGTDPFSTGFGDAHAAAFGIISYGGTVINSGNITVEAVAPDALDTMAVGILFNGDGTLTSTGMLRATGDRAYEVAVMSGTVSLVDTYNMTLDGDPTVGSLFVNSGATLALDGAALTVSIVSGETLFDTEYRIFETEGGTGAVTGAFGSVSALNPAISVLYHDQATVGSIDDTVSLSYQPGSSPQMEATDLLRHAVTLSSDLVGQRLVSTFLRDRVAAATPRWYAASHTVASDAAGSYGAASTADFFFSPYFANVDKDASPVGYDADLVGFVTGLEQRTNGNLYGFHIGFGHAGLDFTGNGYSDNEEDQEVFSAGLHLMGSRGNWTWRGQITGFYGWHDYEGLTGSGLEQRETANYDTYGVRSTLLAGHMFKRGNQMLLPEAGVEYLWLHRESFTTDADTADWDMHSDSLDEHQVSALASLRWLTCLHAGDIELTPSLAAGVRYLMTDDQLDAHQSLAVSGPVTVEADQDELTGTISASVSFRKDQLASELAYSGEFGDDTTMHSAWLRFSYLY